MNPSELAFPKSAMDVLKADYNYSMPRDPSEEQRWPFDKGRVEAGAQIPLPEGGYGTFFLTFGGSFVDKVEEEEEWDLTESLKRILADKKNRESAPDPMQELEEYIAEMNATVEFTGGRIQLKAQANEEESQRHEISIWQSGRRMLTGFVTRLHGDTLDAYAGNYAVFQAIEEDGLWLMVQLQRGTSPKDGCFLMHDMIRRDLGNNLRIQILAGSDPDCRDQVDMVATRISIVDKELDDRMGEEDWEGSDSDQYEALAECHFTYQESGFDAAFGPTIQFIAVRSDQRNKGLLPLLWYHVKQYILEYFHLECRNQKIDPEGHLKIKAVNLTTFEIEQRDGVSITEKDFFLDYAGFSVREMGAMKKVMNSVEPWDMRAELLVPLLPEDHGTTILDDREDPHRSHEPVVIPWQVSKGKRWCVHCNKIAPNLQKCSICRSVYYCSKECQTANWKSRHKAWCKKTRAQVRTKLEAHDWSNSDKLWGGRDIDEVRGLW